MKLIIVKRSGWITITGSMDKDQHQVTAGGSDLTIHYTMRPANRCGQHQPAAQACTDGLPGRYRTAVSAAGLINNYCSPRRTNILLLSWRPVGDKQGNPLARPVLGLLLIRVRPLSRFHGWPPDVIILHASWFGWWPSPRVSLNTTPSLWSSSSYPHPRLPSASGHYLEYPAGCWQIPKT